MKVRVLSDLHLEFSPWTPPAAEADVVILAGDIHAGVCGMEWARAQFPVAEILYVAGNHEFYNFDLDEMRGCLREAAERHGVNLLDPGEVVIGGVRFVGCTLWTDFEIAGNRPARVEYVMRKCQDSINDFFVIRRGGEMFTPSQAWYIHHQQRAWLRDVLARPFEGRTVVVTHHAPSLRSIAPRFAGDALNAAFASDLVELLRPPVDLWIHGHVHNSCDYVESGVRVICNARGYPDEVNPAFVPTFILDMYQA